MASTEAAITMRRVRAGVIDVGSNTVRLLVASTAKRGVDSILSERAYAGLAADIERSGAVSEEKLEQLGALARRYTALAFDHGADTLEVIITAPGRTAENAEEVRDVLAAATKAPVRQLSAEAEGRLAYTGAISACDSVREPVAVVDVGGGSTQLMVGTEEEPAWLRCLDLGSLRLTERFLASDPPRQDELAALAEAVEADFAGLTPPLPRCALATGGTARTLRRIVGRRLGARTLGEALELFTAKPSEELTADHDVTIERARVLPAGTVVLREAQRRLGVKLEVAKGGVREGAVLGLLSELAAAAA